MANKAKFKLECVAPQELTQYNITYNEEIEAKCYQKETFEPQLSCDKCEFLQVKRYK